MSPSTVALFGALALLGLAARGKRPRDASLGLTAAGFVDEARSAPGTTSFRRLANDENSDARRHADVGARGRSDAVRWTIHAKGPLLALLVLAGLAPPGALAFEAVVAMLLIALICVLTLLSLYHAPFLPWYLARRVTIPLGLPRISFYIAGAGPMPWLKDASGGAALAAALAVLSKPRHDAKAASWIEQQLADDAKLAAAGVVAYGLLAASRGELERARTLLESAFTMEAKDSPALARRVALDWLVADHAARGRWRALLKRVEGREGDLSHSARLIVGAAARELGEPSPHDLTLKIAWLRSDHRRRARPLLERALLKPRILYASQRVAPPPAPPPAEPPVAEDALEHALALHLHWLSAAPELLGRHPSRLTNLCAAWDAAFAGDALRERLDARIQALALNDSADRRAHGFRRLICADLAMLAERAEVAITALSRVDDPDSVSREVAAELRRRLLEEVERASAELGRRVDEKRALTAIEEWSEWTTLRRLCERAAALGGLEVRRLIFPQVHRDTCGHAVWLWNKRDEHAISMPVFHWLLREAEAVGDEAAIELQRKNTNAKSG